VKPLMKAASPAIFAIALLAGYGAKLSSIPLLIRSRAENIGARRLHTIMSTLLEEILFDDPEKKINMHIKSILPMRYQRPKK